MKFKFNTLLIIPLFVVLFVSLTFNPTSTIAQTGAPSANTMTGDIYSFDVIGESDATSGREFNLWNASNVFDVNREEDHSNWEMTTYGGMLDAQFVRDANVSGDTFVRVMRETIGDSQSGGSDMVYQRGAPYPEDGTVLPYTNPDRLGDRQHDDETSQIHSNASYSVIMEEIANKELRTDFRINNFDQGLPGAPEVAQMDWITVSVRSMDWFINGVNYNLNTRVVEALFTLDWESNSFTSFPLGDTDPVDFEVNQTLTYSSLRSFYYDDSNGVFLGSNSSTTASYEAFWWNDSFQVIRQGNVDPGFSASNQTVYLDFSAEDEFYLSHTSEGYGNSRLLSSGVNRLEAGESLFYTLETEGQWDSFMDLSMTSGPVTNTRNENSKTTATGDGEAEIRIWRHEPGFVDAVIIMNGENQISEDRTVTDSDPNWPGEFYSDSFFDVFFDIDFFGSPSTDQYEIGAELDDMKFADLGDKKDCNDCGDGGFHIPAPREIPLVSQTRLTSIKPDPTDDPLIINGFDYIVEVEHLEGVYESSWTGMMGIPLGDGPGALFIEATVTMTAHATQGYYWDTKTGVLLAVDEESSVDIFIDFLDDVFIPEDGSTSTEDGSTSTVDIHSEIHIYSKFFLLLNSHPHEYLEVQTEFPVTEDKTTTSEDLTSDQPSDDDTTSETPGLPLPVPILPVISGLGIITLYIRKRKI